MLINAAQKFLSVKFAMTDCIQCGKRLTSDEIALYKKIVNRGADEYMCINCCAEYFNVTVELLEEKIEQFKKSGCQLFDENN